MTIKPIKTKLFLPPKISMKEIYSQVPKLRNGTILFVTSKILSLAQGRCIPISEVKDKDYLVRREADKYLPRDMTPNKWVMLTIKNNILMASAGVDESNAKDYYILWPKNLDKLAQKIQTYLRKRDKINKLGVIITDSHTIPMRRGVVGISLAYYGFKPLRNYVKVPDLFGRPFKMVSTNIVDSLATTAVLIMGEGKEQTPLAVATDLPFIEFQNRKYQGRGPFSSFLLDPKEDLYAPILKSVPWRKKRK